MSARSATIPMQPASIDIWRQKYQLCAADGTPVDLTPDDTLRRVAQALADVELPDHRERWYDRFLAAMRAGALPAGRILSNAGAGPHKPRASLINCIVSDMIHDSIEGIFSSLHDAARTLAAGCGIGYCCSTLRPKGAYINGVGARTGGPLPFMRVFDTMCSTISSAGGRRGAQMLTMHCWHPDIETFIDCKRKDGEFRQFNMSVLVTDAFMEAVERDGHWHLYFPVRPLEPVLDGDLLIRAPWDMTDDYEKDAAGTVLCKVYSTVSARALWDRIMRSTYDYSEPGVLFIDRINGENNNRFCEVVCTTNPCGEQSLPPFGACLLGSINLPQFVINPFSNTARFDLTAYRNVAAVFARMLDNVVEINGLPLEQQRLELLDKRRHGMGFLGLGTALAMLGIRYGSPEAVEFTETAMKEMALANWKVGQQLAEEKGPAPIMDRSFEVTPELMAQYPDLADANVRVGESVPGKVLFAYSRYMRRIAAVDPALVGAIARTGARYTHATSVAPTGTLALSFGNNASNGIEPSFAHSYSRNVIIPGKKTKEKVEVHSYEALLWRSLHGDALFPESFATADTVTPSEHVDMLCAAQKWCDSNISKTVNVPTDISFEDFQHIYRRAYEGGAKGCATFRYNPTRFQGVLVREDDLRRTLYRFTLADGSKIEARGDDLIDYDGETHTAANLFDAIKEGYYGRP